MRIIFLNGLQGCLHPIVWRNQRCMVVIDHSPSLWSLSFMPSISCVSCLITMHRHCFLHHYLYLNAMAMEEEVKSMSSTISVHLSYDEYCTYISDTALPPFSQGRALLVLTTSLQNASPHEEKKIHNIIVILIPY